MKIKLVNLPWDRVEQWIDVKLKMNLVFSQLYFLQLYSYSSGSPTRERSQIRIQPTWLETFIMGILNYVMLGISNSSSKLLYVMERRSQTLLNSKRNGNHDIALVSFPSITHAIANPPPKKKKISPIMDKLRPQNFVYGRLPLAHLLCTKTDGAFLRLTITLFNETRLV